LPIENLGPGFLVQGALDITLSSFGTEKGNASTAAGATNFSGFGAISQRLFDQLFHLRGCYARRQPFPTGVSGAHRLAHSFPLVSPERGPHAQRGITDIAEKFEEFRIAIDVALENVPIVRTR